jgi:hypothetical protein
MHTSSQTDPPPSLPQANVFQGDHLERGCVTDPVLPVDDRSEEAPKTTSSTTTGVASSAYDEQLESRMLWEGCPNLQDD